MQRPWLAAFLAAACAVTACSTAPTVAIATLPPPIGEAQFVPLGQGELQVSAVSGQVVQGQRYHFEVFTHCGFTASAFDFDGSFWTVVGPGDDGNGNPPQGIGNPSDTGVIQLIGANEAIWTSTSGTQVQLLRVGIRVKTFGCD
ncbi:MAG: hypothetical protein L0221_00660 [Chloroflexi bacterium]|nr:hypothetical protein [Chloroflexota bacterium]